MRTTALGKTALTLGALLATGTAATAGLYLTLAGAAANNADNSVAAQDQIAQPQAADPTSVAAGGHSAQNSGSRTSPAASSQSRPAKSGFTATPAPKQTSAPAQTKTKGS